MAATTNLQLVISAKDEASASLQKIHSEMNKLATSAKNKFSNEIKVFGKAFDFAKYAALGLAGATAAVGYSGVKMAGQLESAEAGFKTLLGSADKASDVMKKIKKEAAATPFEIPGLVKGTQALTAITKDGDKSIKILLDVGKAVAASGKGNEELESVIVNLQQIASTGKVTAMDIRQLQMAVPIFNDITKASGLTVDQLQNSSNAAELLFKAFDKAGREGGITARGFIDQAGTWNQLVSNLVDSYSTLSADIVVQSGIFDLAKRSIGGMTEWIEKNKEAIIKFVHDAVEKAIEKTKMWIEKLGGPEGIKNKLIALKDSIANDVLPRIGELVEIIGKTIKFLYEHKEAVLKAIIAWEGLKAALLITETIKVLIKSFGLLSASMSLPVVTALISAGAIAAVYEAISAFKDLKRETGSSLEELKKIDKQNEEYKSKIGTLSSPEKNKQLEDSIKKAEQASKEAKYANEHPILNLLFGNKEEKNKKKKRRRAFGGSVTSGESYIVGEHRPEVFVPSQSGNIKQTNHVGGEITVNFNNPVVRNNQDLDSIIRTVRDVLSREGFYSKLGVRI